MTPYQNFVIPLKGSCAHILAGLEQTTFLIREYHILSGKIHTGIYLEPFLGML